MLLLEPRLLPLHGVLGGAGAGAGMEEVVVVVGGWW